jgi:hypothetical protein
MTFVDVRTCRAFPAELCHQSSRPWFDVVFSTAVAFSESSPMMDETDVGVKCMIVVCVYWLALTTTQIQSRPSFWFFLYYYFLFLRDETINQPSNFYCSSCSVDRNISFPSLISLLRHFFSTSSKGQKQTKHPIVSLRVSVSILLFVITIEPKTNRTSYPHTQAT